MAIPPLPPIGAMPPITPPTTASAAPAAPGFGEALGNSLMEVSNAEHRADALLTDVATGGTTSVHDLMIATTEASLATDALVAVRDRAMEAYHEIMRLQL